MGLRYVFWEDKWLGDTTLWEQYPALYAIVCHKGDTIVHILQSNPPNMSFRRNLYGPRLVSWEALLQRLAHVQLREEKMNSIEIFMRIVNSQLLLCTIL
jgi:hypothetical protein